MVNSPQKSAINSKIEDLIQDKFSNIKSKDLQRGMSFVELSTSIVCDYDVQGEDITDGDDDKGIDSVLIIKNEQGKFVNIFNCKSSQSDNFAEKDLRDIKEGLQYLFENKEDDYMQLKNSNLLSKIEDIREEKESVQEVNLFYCVFNGNKKVNTKISRKILEIEDYFNLYFRSVYPCAKFSLELLNAEDLYKLDIKRKQSLKGKIIELPYYGDRNISNEIEIDNIKGRLATAKGIDIAKLVTTYRDALFEKNVRGWMSFRKYNKEILNSCSSKEDSELFWFLNNGLTIVCEKCVPDPDKKILKITNPQIINGQQTSIVLQKSFENKKLVNSVKVLLKIYETNNNNIIIKVAKATNSQLVVKSRDLVSNNPEQVAIQSEFLRRLYFYERQRGEKKIINKNIKKIFNSFFAAQSILSVFLGHLSLAKKKQEDIIFGEAFYSKIFIKRNVLDVLCSVLLCDFCQNQGKIILRKKLNDEIRYFAYFHIARIIYFKISKKIDNAQIIKDIENNSTRDIKNSYEDAVKILKRIYHKYNKKEKVVSIGHFFSRLEIEADIDKKINKR